MTKQTELKKIKGVALLLLTGAAMIFIVTLFIPPGFWRDGLKAVAEASMVGAMADWFAVVALFRRVPIPFIAAHTAIIPRNKNKIADNLGIFIQEKFLDTSSLVELIRRQDPARTIAGWLAEPDNAHRLGRQILQLMRGFLDFTDDRRIQAFIRSALDAVIDKIDLSASVGAILDSLTKDGRHQDLLDAGLRQLVKLLNKPSTRVLIADQIIQWLKREHPLKEKVLPTEWLGEHSAVAVANAVNSWLDEISRDRGHELRRRFDRLALRLIQRLKNDPATARRAEEIKHYLKNDAVLNTYISGLWDDMRGWLKEDLDRPDSVLHGKVTEAGLWLSQTLARDDGLRSSLNQHLEQAALRIAPDFSAFLTQHISDTVKSWDARDMSRQIELNIGKDLQFIRINGTLVGGVIGLILYLLSFSPVLPALLQLWLQ
ncbi:DUF445 domain-containing protein [Sodalis ligni]|jgi:uncharacterized membrane-anchored protein YjiN (DUF445 family)|uniref:Uncharacterized membrane-anchored protein YjiN (DUF445 family) n=1 Tax=Sodalis ligni TaxID=2697027 RepID=A0A4R1NEK2_9GAMM|nr:DUF445 family protein [Sodalis ligni]TCL06054.1 uncharacterized membrane-anchored protein YjiN (DUF445 family) [Sodalis ligni]